MWRFVKKKHITYTTFNHAELIVLLTVALFWNPKLAMSQVTSQHGREMLWAGNGLESDVWQFPTPVLKITNGFYDKSDRLFGPYLCQATSLFLAMLYILFCSILQIHLVWCYLNKLSLIKVYTLPLYYETYPVSFVMIDYTGNFKFIVCYLLLVTYVDISCKFCDDWPNSC